MRFGEYIRQLRTAKKLTLARASKDLGISPMRLCDIEKGRRFYSEPPPLEFLTKMALLYDHPLDNFLENTEFFKRERSMVANLVKTIEPIGSQLGKLANDMRREARQYTPELEEMAVEAKELAEKLQREIKGLKTRYDQPVKKPKDTLPRYSAKRVSNGQ